MGSVKRTRMSGDNDSPMIPKEITEYVMYCDECRSFELKAWGDPPFDIDREHRRRRLGPLKFLHPKTKWLGLECTHCGTRYADRSDFFKHRYENPRGYTSADIPNKANQLFVIP